MKKFNFSLQKVLEIKEQILENLKIELSNLNNDYRNIEIHINNLKIKLTEVDNEFVEKSSVSISVGEMSYYKIYMSSMLKQIENKEVEKEELQKLIDAKRKEIVSMNKEISSLENLKDKELEKYNKAIMKSEELFIEEFVSNKSIARGYAI